MMWKLLTVMAVLGLVVTAGSPSASAQSQITLGASAGTLTFTGEDSPTSIGLSLGTPCGSCIATQSGTPNGYYVITGSPTITLTETSAAGPTTNWSVAQSGGPLTFEFCSTPDCSGAGNKVYLSGTLSLDTLTQTGKNGQFNYNSVANLTVTGGTEAALWGSEAIGVLNLSFSSSTNLGSLLNNDNSVSGVKIGSGTIDPTPEPSSMLLFGTGLLACGVFLRRRLT